MKLMKIVQQQSGLSRRKARDLIEEGEVNIDGMEECNPFEDYQLEEIDRLYLRGHPLPTYPPQKRAYKFYKPTGMLCSHDDPHYGRTLGRTLRSEGFIGYRWAGRLDQDAEGLLLLSNDGQLVHALTHPRYEVEKRYHLWISEDLGHGKIGGIIEQFMEGIEDNGDLLQIKEGGLINRGEEHTELELVLTEGKKNEIKRLMDAADLTIVRLRRVAIGPIELGDLSPEDIQRVSSDEWEKLSEYKESALAQREDG
ncbi:rRNA pseudouridine synthase [Candidatus Bipolaricaulota bacterium]|nr:rRNA pseudouridine synthase [Candidatus Bipolaricaulota bacterium]